MTWAEKFSVTTSEIFDEPAEELLSLIAASGRA